MTNHPLVPNKKTEVTKDNALLEFTKVFVADGWVLSSTQKYSTSRLLHPVEGDEPPDDYVFHIFTKYLKHHDITDCVKEQKAVIAYVFKALPVVLGIRFKPKASNIITVGRRQYLNKWQAFQPNSTDIKPLPAIAACLLHRMFPDPAERHKMIQYIAHAIQCPDERPSYGVMLLSEQGMGKGYMFEKVVTPLFANQTTIARSYLRLTGQFSTLLVDNMFILLDDPKCKSDATATELKSVLSEERAYIERKHQDGKTQHIYTRIILASNEDRPLPLDDGDRRWFAPAKLVHKVSKAETQRVISRFDRWLKKPGSLESIYEYLLNYSLGDFNAKHIDQTATLKSVIGLSANSADYFFPQFIETHTVFTQAELLSGFADEGLSRPSDPHIKYVLESMGYAKKQFTMVDKSRPNYWAPKGTTQDDFNLRFPPKEIKPQSCVPAWAIAPSA